MKIPSYIKAVIFDMDGLLIDSEPYWTKADAEFAQRHGKKYTQEINKRIIGLNHRTVMEILRKEYDLAGNTEELIKERRDILYEKLFKNISYMEGAEKVIQALFSKGYPLAVATAGFPREKIIEILKKLQATSYFSVLVSGYDITHGKPAPDIYLKTAELLHVDPSECLVLEDAPNGVLSGKAAGMTVFGVNSDEAFHKGLKNAGADNILKSLSEIQV
jgi:HAD superfamily hydrolase (TIGR01509 family)